MTCFEIIIAIVNIIAVIAAPIVAVKVGQYLQDRTQTRKKLCIQNTDEMQQQQMIQGGQALLAGSMSNVLSCMMGGNIPQDQVKAVEVFSKNTTTIDMFGSAKYRCYDYGGDDHIAVVHTEDLPKHAAIFVTTATHKAAHTGKFDYGHNFYAKDADALDIMLPAKDGQPDYAYMELLIAAIQKMVIRDVVLYVEAKVNATKAVISE